jgi:hypothetical protein
VLPRSPAKAALVHPHTDPAVRAQPGHRHRAHSDDVTPEENSERTGQLRRTRAVRRGVVAAGATGALGAALAIGTTIHANGTTGSGGATDDQTFDPGEGQSFDQTPQLDQDDQGDQGDQGFQGGQLAAPGGAGPAQGRSGGS